MIYHFTLKYRRSQGCQGSTHKVLVKKFFSKIFFSKKFFSNSLSTKLAPSQLDSSWHACPCNKTPQSKHAFPASHKQHNSSDDTSITDRIDRKGACASTRHAPMKRSSQTSQSPINACESCELFRRHIIQNDNLTRVSASTTRSKINETMTRAIELNDGASKTKTRTFESSNITPNMATTRHKPHRTKDGLMMTSHNVQDSTG